MAAGMCGGIEVSRSILLIKRLKIHNANAHSSPYSIGFPAMTAWLGAAHALQRKLRVDKRFDDLEELSFCKIGVVCHDFKLHTYKGANQYEQVLIGTGNPLDKSGQRPSFIEEARCDLTVSLILEYDCEDDADLVDAVIQILPTLKMASGDIQPVHIKQIKLQQIHGEKEFHSLVGELMPGFCLIERRDILQHAMEQGQDALDGLLDALKVTHHCEVDDTGKVTWSSARQQKGWLVPISTGYQGISELSKAQLQRDPDTPHRFAESVVTLAEFVMPYRFETLDQMLWHYHIDLENNLYLCQQSQGE
jgi:CRISPR-associated protein Csy2